MKWLKIEYPETETIWLIIKLPESLHAWTKNGECIDEVCEIYRFTNPKSCTEAYDAMIMQAVVAAISDPAADVSELLESLPDFITGEDRQ